MMAAFAIFPSWEAFVIMIAMLSFFVTTLLYMLSKAFDIQNLMMWAKGEYLQVGVTFLIAFFAIGFQHAFLSSLMIATSDMWMISMGPYITNPDILACADPTPPPNAVDICNPIFIGKAYIAEVITCQKRVFWTIATINLYHEFAKSISTDIIGVEPLSGGYLGGPVTFWQLIGGNMVYSIMFNFIQYRFLSLIDVTMLSIFLPIGLLFRAFPLTRGVGGFITAFALGFAFVFPFSYLLMMASLPHVTAWCANAGQEVMANLAPWEDTSRPPSSTNPSDPNQAPSFSNPSDVAVMRYKYQSSENDISLFLDRVTTLIPVLLLQALIFPLVALTVTLTFVRQTGALFGADLAEVGRGLIKLI
jgi:hypothetical protein